MNSRERLILWLLIFVLIGTFLIHIRHILLPFVLAGIIAYFLDPAVEKLEKHGFSRPLATVTILGSFLAVLILAGAILLPLLYNQVIEFAQQVPQYVADIQTKLLPRLSVLVKAHSHNSNMPDIKNELSNLSESVLHLVAPVLTNIWQSGMAIVDLFSLLFLTPIVSFYIMRDWRKIIAHVNSILPLQYAGEIRTQCALIDKALSGYIRGQTNVCLILGTFYAVGLTFAGLQFGFLIGFLTGLLAFIPYAGLLTGCCIGLAVAFFQFDDWVHIAVVAGVFATGQIIESNFITPKLVGDKVGLSPIWLIFGMLSGAALFGFTGVLIAVPTTAIMGVLVRFAMAQYLQSPLYLGRKSMMVGDSTSTTP